jgi:hypothetical protein
MSRSPGYLRRLLLEDLAQLRASKAVTLRSITIEGGLPAPNRAAYIDGRWHYPTDGEELDAFQVRGGRRRLGGPYGRLWWAAGYARHSASAQPAQAETQFGCLVVA